MRVTYDISMLGVGHADPMYRAGIFRATEEVAKGLARSGECELAFSSTGALQFLPLCLDYLAAHPELRGLPLAAPALAPALLRALSVASARAGGAPAPVGRTASRRLLAGAERLAGLAFGPLNHRVPRGTDIFHSPVLGLPPRRWGDRRSLRFLTVYDLTTIRFPELFEADVLEGMARTFRTLTSDDWVVASSECTRNDLCEHRPDLDPARVFVTPFAADPGLFHPVACADTVAAARRRYGVPKGPYLLCLNTLNPRKNLDRLVRAFARLAEQEGAGELSLVLVGGSGWKTEELFRAIEEARGVHARIVLTGYVADQDLAPLYSGALAFVYPSLYEGFGLPPLEAMQCGVPVITSNTSSLPEVVGDAGVIVDPSCEDALCQAMLDVYRDSSLRAELRSRSLRRAAGFTWQACVERTLAAYRAALTA